MGEEGDYADPDQPPSRSPSLWLLALMVAWFLWCGGLIVWCLTQPGACF